MLLTLDLPSFVWKPLVGIAPTRADLKQIDYSLYGYLKFIRACDKADFEGETRKIFEKFSTTRSDKTKVPLIPGGEDVEVTYPLYILIYKKRKEKEKRKKKKEKRKRNSYDM